MNEKRHHLEAMAARDYQDVLGKTLVAWDLDGYELATRTRLKEAPTACLVRVIKAEVGDTRRWNEDGDCLKPIWRVVLTSPHPSLNDYREFFVFGYTRHTDGRVEEPQFETLEGWKQKVATPGYEMTPRDEAAFKLLEGYHADVEMEVS